MKSGFQRGRCVHFGPFLATSFDAHVFLFSLQMFSFHFWSNSRNPLGPKWTLSPEPAENWHPTEANFDLGYSREECRSVRTQRSCSHTRDRSLTSLLFLLQIPLVPHSERVNQAFLYAKRSNFFSNANYACKSYSLL